MDVKLTTGIWTYIFKTNFLKSLHPKIKYFDRKLKIIVYTITILSLYYTIVSYTVCKKVKHYLKLEPNLTFNLAAKSAEVVKIYDMNV